MDQQIFFGFLVQDFFFVFVIIREIVIGTTTLFIKRSIDGFGWFYGDDRFPRSLLIIFLFVIHFVIIIIGVTIVFHCSVN